MEPYNNQIRDKQSEIKLSEAKISMLKSTHNNLKSERDRILKTIDDLKADDEKTIENLENLTNEREKVKTRITSAEKEIFEAKNQISKMREVLIQQRQTVEEAKSNLSGYQNKSTVLEALKKLQNSGRITGFHGRLGDLGTVDDKYDIAISTACPMLDDIVVDTVECGQQCIDHLRKNKLGYRRFILLEKLRSFDLRKIKTPEGVPRLFDQVNPMDDIFKPAFYSVLRDTLVAENLQQANRVAYGSRRFRVVTLDGKLIDLSGTMSGGGGAPQSGAMRSKSDSSGKYSREDVLRMESQLSAKETNFNSAISTLHEMESALQKLTDRLPAIDVDISKTQLEQESRVAELTSYNQRLFQIDDELSDHENNQIPLINEQNNLSKLREELSSVLNQSKSNQDKIDRLKEIIMQKGGLELQMQISKVDSLEKRIEIIQDKQKKDKAKCRKLELDIKRRLKDKTKYSDEASSCNSEIDTLSIRLDGVQKDKNELDNFLLTLNDQENELKEKEDNVKEELAGIEKELNDFKAKELTFTEKLNNFESVKSQITNDLEKFNNELSNLKIRDVVYLLAKLEEGILVESDEQLLPNNEVQNASITHDGDGDVEMTDISMQQNDKIVIDESLSILSESELECIDVEVLNLELQQLQDYLDNFTGDINVLEEYARRLAEYQRRKLDLNQAVAKREEVRVRCERLKQERLEKFLEGFGIISMTLKEMYQMITMGGNAELELVDSLDPFSEGVLFSVMPPKKSWRNISNLSGGEKTLSSLALVFALHKYKPTPLYVMDEIDAALDFRNVSIVANYIKERTKNAQFIVISLRNNMFELAQHLVGIYKNNNMTRSTTLQNVDVLHTV